MSAETTLFLVITGHFHIKQALDTLLLILRVCAQSCLTLCNPIDCSPAGSSVHGIFEARILERVAISLARYHVPNTVTFLVTCHMKNGLKIFVTLEKWTRSCAFIWIL